MTFQFLDPYQLSSLEELKKAYRKLCLKYHPDICKSVSKAEAEEIMKQINAEYSTAAEVIKRRAQAGGNVNEKDAHESAESLMKFADLINQFVVFDDLNIEIIGVWLWVSGQTFKHKSELLAAGFRWSKQRKMWYWHAPQDGPAFHRKSKMSTSEMRLAFGSTTVKKGVAGAVVRA